MLSASTAVYFIFQFLAGCSGVLFLSIAGGSVSDMFATSEVATYITMLPSSAASLMIKDSLMAIYTVCPFLGPAVGLVLIR